MKISVEQKFFARFEALLSESESVFEEGQQALFYQKSAIWLQPRLKDLKAMLPGPLISKVLETGEAGERNDRLHHLTVRLPGGSREAFLTSCADDHYWSFCDVTRRSDRSEVGTIRDSWLRFTNDLELTRCRSLLHDDIPLPDLHNLLHTLAEKGDYYDWRVCQEILKNPNDLQRQALDLVRDIARIILRRLSSPGRVVEDGEALYQRYKRKWEVAFFGEYVAIFMGDMLFHNKDLGKLQKQIADYQNRMGKARFYVRKVGGPLPQMIGPLGGTT